jgi:Zn-dependent protease
VSAPLFIPFMGALITLKQMPHNAWREAKLAIAGPLLGSAGALALYIAGVAYDSNSLKAIAFLGFFINLFNLLPVVPLDGGRAAAALHPLVWLVGILGLAGLAVWHPNPILFLFLIIGGMEAWKRLRAWRAGDTATAEYYSVTRDQRIAVAVTYLGLAALLVVGMAYSHVHV